MIQPQRSPRMAPEQDEDERADREQKLGERVRKDEGEAAHRCASIVWSAAVLVVASAASKFFTSCSTGAAVGSRMRLRAHAVIDRQHNKRDHDGNFARREIENALQARFLDHAENDAPVEITAHNRPRGSTPVVAKNATQEFA